MATFVLVHGAWHGGWCWNKVTPLLRKTGAEVFVPTLSGLGEKAHLAQRMDPRDIDLDLHVQDVIRLLEYEDLQQVILVGHAYAGMVISGVAEECHNRIDHLVYVNGVVPSDGESMADQLAPVRGPEFAAWVRGHIDRGEGFLAPPASPEELGQRWGIIDPADRDWMFARVTPQPAAAMAAPVRISHPERRRHSPQLRVRRGGRLPVGGGARRERRLGYLPRRFRPRHHGLAPAGVGRNPGRHRQQLLT